MGGKPQWLDTRATTGGARIFRISSTDKSLATNQFAVQYLDNKNVIWLGPGLGGIVQFDIASEKLGGERKISRAVDRAANFNCHMKKNRGCGP